MTRQFAIGAALLVTASEAAFGGCGDHAFYSAHKDEGTRVGLIATNADLARDPAWKPGSGEPPLSPARAYDLALAWARASVNVASVAVAARQCAPAAALERLWASVSERSNDRWRGP
jgi:hypothetical protein